MSYSSPPGGGSRSAVLLRAALALASEHDLEQVLQRIVENAAEVADARYAALGTYDEGGKIQRFVYHGIDVDLAARIGTLPRGRGLLGEVNVAEGPIRLDDLAADPRSCGFPPHHPPMRTFLGVPITGGGRRYGNLYLTEKRGGLGFNEEDEHLVVAIAAFAAVAIEGAELVVAERERAAALVQLAAAQERQRLNDQLMASVIDAQEAERARVARDLHDEIGQSLTSVLLALRLAETSADLASPDLADVRTRIADVRELVTEALHDVRQLAFDLRPTVLDDLGLVAALQRLVADVSARHGVPVKLTFDGLGDDARLAGQLETVVYRMVQEALTNIIRHARARRARVSVVHEDGRLRAVVEDDGVGFHVDDASGGSLGLRGMRERAALAGGTVEIKSAPHSGTVVVLEVPVG